MFRLNAKKHQDILQTKKKTQIVKQKVLMKTKSFVWDGSDEEGLSKKVMGDALKNKFTFT